MKRLAVLSVLALSACPYDMEAAGLTSADGGVSFNYAGGQSFFIPVAGSNSYRPLRAMPSQDQLCMLYIGDMGNHTDYPAHMGSWIEDVRAMWWLGTPTQESDFQGADDVQIGYTYRDPKSNDPTGMSTVSLSLRFEYVDAVDVTSVIDTGGHWKGTRWYHPYFLSGITAQGFDFLSCWDWRVRERDGSHFTPCPNCVNASQVTACAWMSDGYDDVSQCFR
jgi:hypothetical protein